MLFFYALIAYTLFAGATVADKYLLSRPIPDARVYAFYTGILSPFVVLLIPFSDFVIPNIIYISLSVLAGVFFMLALYLFFTALRIGEVSRVGISAGGLVPFFTLLFVYVASEELPSSPELIAFSLLAGGGLIIMLDRFKDFFHNFNTILLVFSSSLVFGLYFRRAKL